MQLRAAPAGAGHLDFTPVRLKLSCDCREAIHAGVRVVTDPDLRKLTRADFDSMVREILEDTSALFSLSSFRRGIARGSGRRPPAIARLEFLRSRINELQRVVGAIVRNPRHRLTAEEVSVPYHRATRVTVP